MDKTVQVLWITFIALTAMNAMLEGVIMASHGNVKEERNMLRFANAKVSCSCSTRMNVYAPIFSLAAKLSAASQSYQLH